MAENTLILWLRALMPVVALIGGFFIYKASRNMGGIVGKRFKILSIGALFLALYGIVTSTQDAGITLFSYRDKAFGVVHVVLHLAFSITTFVGFASIWRSGGEME